MANPLLFLQMAQGMIGLVQQVQTMRAQAATVADDPQAAVEGLAEGAAQAAQEYQQLYKASAAFLMAFDKWVGKKKVSADLAEARAALLKEHAETYSLLTGMPIPAEVRAEWGG